MISDGFLHSSLVIHCFLVRWQLVLIFLKILLLVTTAFCCDRAFTLFHTTVQHKDDVFVGSARFGLLPVVCLFCFLLILSCDHGSCKRGGIKF